MGANNPPGVPAAYEAAPSAKRRANRTGSSASDSAPSKRALGDDVATADQLGREPRQHADGGADHARAHLDRPGAEAVGEASLTAIAASSVRLYAMAISPAMPPSTK